MNNLELAMVDTLKDLKENHFVIGVKAEFEAEGTRMEEAMRLKEVITKAGIDFTIKIGGCEALKDMYDAKSLGVNRIVAPMIESPYALTKFIESTKMAFPSKEERDLIQFAINIETVTACNTIDQIMACPAVDELNAIVIGRVDMSRSLGLTREDINSPQVFAQMQKVLSAAKKKGLAVAAGGGVSAASLPLFRELKDGGLDYYETRKVLFKCPEATTEAARAGILKAVGFELMWLKNKRDYYYSIESEDAERLEMLSARYSKMIEEVGGKY